MTLTRVRSGNNPNIDIDVLITICFTKTQQIFRILMKQSGRDGLSRQPYHVTCNCEPHLIVYSLLLYVIQRYCYYTICVITFVFATDARVFSSYCGSKIICLTRLGQEIVCNLDQEPAFPSAIEPRHPPGCEITLVAQITSHVPSTADG